MLVALSQDMRLHALSLPCLALWCFVGCGSTSDSNNSRTHPPADAPAPTPPASDAGSAAPAGDTSCGSEKAEALAAYSHALLWYLKQDESEAQKAIAFLDAWNNVTAHVGYQGSDNSPLQSGWTGTLWARAAELIRYT